MPQTLTYSYIRADNSVPWYDETQEYVEDSARIEQSQKTSNLIAQNKIIVNPSELNEDGTVRTKQIIILDPTIWGETGYSEETAINQILFPSMKEYNLKNNISISIELIENVM